MRLFTGREKACTAFFFVTITWAAKLRASANPGQEKQAFFESTKEPIFEPDNVQLRHWYSFFFSLPSLSFFFTNVYNF